MSVFECGGMRCQAKDPHAAVVVNYWHRPLTSMRQPIAELQCSAARFNSIRIDDRNEASAKAGRFWSRYEPLHEPIPGDELSICIEAWLHQLAHYVRHMPMLLARSAA